MNTAGVALLRTQFPAWTVLVNVIGSLLMGLLAGAFLFHWQQAGGDVLRPLLATGILGG